MNNDTLNTHSTTRRRALQRIVALSLSLYLGGATANVSRDETLKQCAAGITACQELGRGDDLSLAFEGASVILQRLQPLLGESRYRKDATNVATQAAILRAVLGRHLQGTTAAIRYAQQAVAYGRDADSFERLEALATLVWAYYYSPVHAQDALRTAEQAAAVLRELQGGTLPSLFGQVYSQLAVMQAKNGLRNHAALRRSEKDFAEAHSSTDDPVAVLILNETRTLYHKGDHGTSLAATAQLIDSTTLRPKRPMSERERIAALSITTLASLKVKNKDLEHSTRLWHATMIGVHALKSEQRFEESVQTYQIMDALWSDDARVQALRPLTIHW